MTKETAPPGTRHRGKAARREKSGGLVRANTRSGRDVVRVAGGCRQPAHHLHPARRPPTETYRTQTAQFEGLGSLWAPGSGRQARHTLLVASSGACISAAQRGRRRPCLFGPSVSTTWPMGAWTRTILVFGCHGNSRKSCARSEREPIFVNPNRFRRWKSELQRRHFFFLQHQQTNWVTA